MRCQCNGHALAIQINADIMLNRLTQRDKNNDKTIYEILRFWELPQVFQFLAKFFKEE